MPVCLYCGRLFLTQNNKIKRVTVPFYLTILNLFFATFFSDFLKIFFFLWQKQQNCEMQIQNSEKTSQTSLQGKLRIVKCEHRIAKNKVSFLSFLQFCVYILKI